MHKGCYQSSSPSPIPPDNSHPGPVANDQGRRRRYEVKRDLEPAVRQKFQNNNNVLPDGRHGMRRSLQRLQQRLRRSVAAILLRV